MANKNNKGKKPQKNSKDFDEEEIKICKNCEGNGEVEEYNFDEGTSEPPFNIVTCRFCNGTGEEK